MRPWLLALLWLGLLCPAQAAEMGLIGLNSPAFKDGEKIPKNFACDGQDISPALRFSGIPAAAKSLAVLVSDPDAAKGVFAHWVLFNLPPDTHALLENQAKTKTLKNEAAQGQNDFGRPGYAGPCPNPGQTHRFVFEVFALDVKLDLPAEAGRVELLTAMEGHILARGKLTGKYKK